MPINRRSPLAAVEAHLRLPKPVPILENQIPLLGDDHTEARKVEAENRRELIATLRGLKRVLYDRIYGVDRALELMEHGIQLPDVAQALGLPPVTPRITRSKLWMLRPGTDAAVVADLLEAAGRKGLTEDELVTALQAQGRMTTAKYPRRSMHWTLTNLQKRSGGAVQRDPSGKWVHVRNIWRKSSAEA